ncbi:MAG: YopX family protein [Leadbetterella sp.]|nr:YopX family protein [Leadbetterella sp.]
MNRRIRFRGKDVTDGCWVYGYLYIDERDGKHWIITSKNTNADMHMDEVIPKSIGQSIGVYGYKGLYSTRYKNKIELFEGDIVEAMSEGTKGTFVIKFRQEGNPGWLLFPNWLSFKHWHILASNIGNKEDCLYDDLKLIGNITDNPELIENG